MPDPDEKAYSDEDLEAARIIAELRSAGIPDEGLLEITRVLGRSLAQGAEVIRSVAAGAFMESGITEYELARRNAEAASQFLPAAGAAAPDTSCGCTCGTSCATRS